VGNLLHEDSLIMRLTRAIQEGKFEAKYFKIPFQSYTYTMESYLWKRKEDSQELYVK